MIIETVFKVQDSIQERYPDNSEGLSFLLKIYKLYIGIGKNKPKANNVKLEKNQLVRNKEHLIIAHFGRLYNSHLNILQSNWKQNFNIAFSDDLIQKIYTLATSSYKNVRHSSIELITSICNRNTPSETNKMSISVRPKPNIRPKFSAKSAEHVRPKVSANLPNIRPEKNGTKEDFFSI